MVYVQRSIWHEPRPAEVPPIGRTDWLLVGVLAVAAVVEGVARPDLTWRPVVIGAALALLPALIWRRRHPLAAALVGWSLAALLLVVQWATHAEDVGLYAMLAVLILLYSLVRWGSGREIVVGTAFVALVVALGMYVSSAGVPDVVGGSVLLLAFVSLAAVFRYRADLWERQQRDIRNQERLALARDLHDTVAHHVSAIAVQAQAGSVVAGTEPAVAVRVLAAIESEASRTLAEMRSMVRLLREDDGAAFEPARGVTDLLALARSDTTPVVEVSLSGSLSRLPDPVDATVYRVAQESLTNALRHARRATRVVIDVRREGDVVRVRVRDDGQAEPGRAPVRGFGLTGMAERAHLLGGSFAAGPGPDGGWIVEAALPARAES